MRRKKKVKIFFVIIMTTQKTIKKFNIKNIVFFDCKFRKFLIFFFLFTFLDYTYTYKY